MEVTPRPCQDQRGLCLVGFLSGSAAYVLSAIISLLAYVLPLRAQLPERVQTHKRRPSSTTGVTAAPSTAKPHPQPQFKLNSIILPPPDLRTPPTLQRHVSFPNDFHRSPTLSPTLLPTVQSESESESDSESDDESVATPPEIARQLGQRQQAPASAHIVGDFGERLSLSPPPIYDATLDTAATASISGSTSHSPLPKSLSTSRIKQRCQQRRSGRKAPPTPIPRTQPYEAPFFFPTPDSPAAFGYVDRVREERMQTSHRAASFHVTSEPITAEPVGALSTPSSARASPEPAEPVGAKVEVAIDLLVQSPKRRHSWMIGSGRSPSREGEEKTRRRLSWRRASPRSSASVLTSATPEKESSPSRSFFRRKKTSSSSS